MSKRFLVASIVVLWLGTLHAQTEGLNIKLTDESGKPVSFAQVELVQTEGGIVEARTGEDGMCHFQDLRPPVRLKVTAAGFSPLMKELTVVPESVLELQLQISHLADFVTVTASRAELPGSRSTQDVILLSGEDRKLSAAQTIDDYLRTVPGFTLFRRSSSLVAHPTSQGVSMRAVGPSGASRSLVLTDGVPLNDPFGGWVYWSRIPRLGLDHIEVLRGGASDLYGSNALGGVIQTFRRPPATRTLDVEGFVGNREDRDFGFFASHRAGKQGFSLSGDIFHFGGYNQVAAGERGRVDIPATSEHHVLEGLWDVRINPNSRAYALASEFSERRGNGTPLQNNDTQIRSIAAGLSFVTGKNEWQADVFGSKETFDSTFSSIALDRDSELLARNQRVPSQSMGVQGIWRRSLSPRHLLLVGGDYTLVKGASDEIIFAAGIPSSSSRVDGRQDLGGLYLQDLIQATDRIQVVGGLRWDGWENRNAFSFTRTFSTGAARQTLFSPKSNTAWSPKLGMRFDVGHDISLRGSISRSFRAPTLNELYRSFRLGSVVTNANPELAPERATSGEVGADWGLASAFAVRGTLFWTGIRDNIANVTISTTPALITRQRKNLGSTRSRGLELDAIYRPDSRWMFSAGYFLSDATVLTAPLSPEVIGLKIPQVPRHQAVFEMEYRKPGSFYVSSVLRLSSRQFDDDLNSFVLDSYQVVDLSVGKPIGHLAELFFSCENLFNQAYAVGRTPVQTLGAPRLVHGGIRFRIE